MFRLFKSFNPFVAIYNNLPETAELVTVEYLDKVAEYLDKGKYDCETYGEVFEVLQYLHDNSVLTLIPVANTNLYKIAKGVYDKKE